MWYIENTNAENFLIRKEKTYQVLACHHMNTQWSLYYHLQALLQNTETPWNSLHIHNMANAFAHVQTTYEHINVFSLLHRSAAVDLNTSNVQKSYNAYQHQSQSQMLQICTVHCRSTCLSTRQLYTQTTLCTCTFLGLRSSTKSSNTELCNMTRYKHLTHQILLLLFWSQNQHTRLTCFK